MKKNIKLILAYEGTKYLGWQRTRMGPSIQEEVEKALSQIVQHRVQLQAASRTDARVHAQGQSVGAHICSQIALPRLHLGLNSLLPTDIRVLHIEEMPTPFHPTLDAKAKEYHYHLCLGLTQLPHLRLFSWHCPYTLNINSMRQAAHQLIGTHNFAAFCNQRKQLKEDTIRHLERIDIVQCEGQRLRIEIVGQRFLYKMARNLVGTLIYIGRGKMSLDDIFMLFNTDQRSLAGVTAPAHGLTLFRVLY